MTEYAARNLLADETSPFLLLHKDDPVQWRPWGQAALDEAKATGKPIYLSSGYTSCHWCHVMRHESFSDPAIAATLNANFVNVKLDREERPDIDQIYQTSVQALGHQGGWPLNLFLSPDGVAFTGSSYLPPEDRDGRRSFRMLIDEVVKTFADRRDAVDQAVEGVRGALERVWNTDTPLNFDPNIVEPVSRRLTQRVDLFWGGFEGAPKFPQTSAMTLIWRAFMRTAAPQFGNAVTLTLDQMSLGGVYDHLGGGYARYAIDERWLIPHFEKMLYDNAASVELLTLVWQMTRSPLYAARVDETIDWLLREMVTKEGGFASSLDSDSEGEEGKYYVWSEAEIDDVLGPNDAPFFKQVYGVTAQGNWNGKNVLHRLNAQGFLRPDQEAVLTRCRRMLQMARAKRVRPQLDDKMLADWNGMAIAALVQASAVFRKPEWHMAALRAFRAIEDTLAEGDKLYHMSREGRRSTAETTAEGYAQMTRAALILFEFSSDPRYLERAKQWTARLEAKFRDTARGGYYLTSADATDAIIRVRTSLDQATPNYNGVIVENLARLYFLTGSEAYRNSSNAAVSAFGQEVIRQAANTPTLLNGTEFVIAAAQVVIVGDDRQPETQTLVRAVLERSVPCRMMTVLKPGQKLPSNHPAHGKGQVNGKPTAYACVGQSVSEPITDPVQLSNMLLPRPFQIQAQLIAQQQAAQRASAANAR
jgi:uncharacterized protein YyaL (SSP411 family)